MDDKKYQRLFSSIGRSWIDVDSNRKAFLSFVIFKVSDGIRVRFWEDAWADSSPRSTIFPDFCGLSSKNGKTLAISIVLG